MSMLRFILTDKIRREETRKRLETETMAECYAGPNEMARMWSECPRKVCRDKHAENYAGRRDIARQRNMWKERFQ
jgi:hypothetical protein